VADGVKNVSEDFIVKITLLIITVLTLFLNACVTTQTKILGPEEMEKIEKIGSVEKSFISFQPIHIIANESIQKKSYAKLMEEAREKYNGNIDIVNIIIDGSFTPVELLFIYPLFLLGNFQKITATGDVVLYNTATPPRDLAQNTQSNTETTYPAVAPPSRTAGATANIEGAIYRAIEALIDKLPDRSKIAVLTVSSKDRDSAIFVMDELEFQLVDTGSFTVVDRKTLDQVRTEQNFQSSGDVDDDSAVSMGKMLGADIVITGSISGTGSTQRLTVKALDVQTAEIVAMARESF
jgi:TolB-like protein